MIPTKYFNHGACIFAQLLISWVFFKSMAARSRAPEERAGRRFSKGAAAERALQIKVSPEALTPISTVAAPHSSPLVLKVQSQHLVEICLAAGDTGPPDSSSKLSKRPLSPQTGKYVIPIKGPRQKRR